MFVFKYVNFLYHSQLHCRNLLNNEGNIQSEQKGRLILSFAVLMLNCSYSKHLDALLPNYVDIKPWTGSFYHLGQHPKSAKNCQKQSDRDHSLPEHEAPNIQDKYVAQIKFNILVNLIL